VIVLDTTVLVYAVGTEHTFRQPCQRLVKAIADGDVEATTTAGVIQEFTPVHYRAVPDGAINGVLIHHPVHGTPERDLTVTLTFPVVMP
jgi:predicted nucleic acid-binding protein